LKQHILKGWGKKPGMKKVAIQNFDSVKNVPAVLQDFTPNKIINGPRPSRQLLKRQIKSSMVLFRQGELHTL
jgi:hypothetical protein